MGEFCPVPITSFVTNNIVTYFDEIPEYRKLLANIHHKLGDIITIVVCAIVAGADGPQDIFEWADAHRKELTEILKLQFGIPSRDTFRRALEAIKPEQFQKCFLGWIESFRNRNATDCKEHIAIDGKTLRGSYDRKKGLGCLHIVSAWSTANGIALGQLATEEKSNEITAIPELLDSIEIEGAVVSIDAMGTQTKIAEKIIAKKGGYVLNVKSNQPKLHDAIKDFFATTDLASKKVSRKVEEDVSHGRIECREYFQATIPAGFGVTDRWVGARTIGMATRTHDKGDGVKRSESRYYISSERRNGGAFARYARSHWGIENSLHWVMDVVFGEDDKRIRERTIGDNISWIRRFAITLYRQHPAKKSMVGKRKRAGWSFDFLMELIRGTLPYTEK